MRGTSWLADDLLVYEDGLCSMGLVNYNSYLCESLLKESDPIFSSRFIRGDTDVQ